MSNLIRHSRGVGTAIVVLAISAGAVFASSAIAPVGSVTPATATATEEPTEAPEATQAPEAKETPEATESPEATEKADGPDKAPAPTPTPGTHGALVAAAAHMDLPAGFHNRGEFVSCVAHSDLTLATVKWSTFTAAYCGVADAGKAAPLPVPADGNDRGFGPGQPAVQAPSH